MPSICRCAFCVYHAHKAPHHVTVRTKLLPPNFCSGMVAVSSTCMQPHHAGTLAHKPLVSEHPDTVPQQCRVIPEHVSHDSKPHETLDPELNNSPLTAFPRSLATYTHVGRSTFSSTEILYTCYNDHIHVTPFLGARGKPRREACESGQGPTGGQGGGWFGCGTP